MNDYTTALESISETHPTLVGYLRAASRRRQETINSLISGARLRGLESLLSYIAVLTETFSQHHLLSQIAFLTERCQESVVLASEAALSGFFSNGIDAMRTVMEIEFLLRDFRYNKGHLEEWLAADYWTQSRRFGANALRQRHANRLGIKVQDLPESADYKMHSRVLHVTTLRNPFGGTPGMGTPSAPFGEDAVFWEIFEHSRRFVLQAHGLKRRRAPRLRLDRPEKDKRLEDFWDAWRRTQEMQLMAWL